jgi:uncharacterized protein (TIGR02246 family)
MNEIVKAMEDYVKAFEKGDAKTIAAGYMPDAEYVGPEGKTVKGREAIEKAYVQFFKEHPGAKIQIQIETLRRLGANTALEEGTIRLARKGAEPEATRYSTIHVREGGKWLTAVTREFDLDPSELVTLRDLDWLIGEWLAKNEEMELRTRYEWEDDRNYLVAKFELKEKGKSILKGTQRIARDAASGGLRAWVFDASGGFGESFWIRDGKRWLVEAVGTLPDGSQTTATNIIVPVDGKSFTYQSVERTVSGVEVPDLPPLKVTRVEK